MRSLAAVLCTLVLPLLLAVSASPAAAAGGPRLDPGERALIRAINRQRSARGLHAVRPHGGLTRAADKHSAEMLATNTFGHGAMARRVRAYARLHRVGENLAWSHGFSARSIVGMWLNSAPHRKVMLRRSYRYIGVGRRSGHQICMVTADFGTRH
jgi:uncharacterized protein YkwD